MAGDGDYFVCCRWRLHGGSLHTRLRHCRLQQGEGLPRQPRSVYGGGRAGGTSSHCSWRRQALCFDRMGLPGSFPAWLCSLTAQFLSYLLRFTMPLSTAILLNIVLRASKPIS